jgi:hypothetical protein
MELAVLGLGAYLAKSLLDNGGQPLVDESKEEMQKTMLESPYEMNLHEMRTRGALAPSFGATRARMPWDPSFPPYYIASTATGGPNESPTERIFHSLANAQEHERLDVAEQIMHHRPHYARKKGQAIWSAFNEELHLEDADPSVPPRSTDHVGFQWMPPNPTDSDWNEAALLTRAMPPNPVLFTPDAYYMTAPGQPFRHGQGQTH